jgi:DNA-binding GntR family transcriptional regulator
MTADDPARSSELGYVRKAAPVREQVVSILRTALADGRFAPGDRLVEQQLCEMLDTSRTSLREALRHLEVEGLVTVVAGKGATVATISRQDIVDLYQVRANLEGLAARLFAEVAPTETVDELERAVDAFAEAAKTGLVEDLVAAKDVFYEILFRGAGNDALRRMMATIHLRVRQMRHASLGQTHRPSATEAELREIIAAIRRQDGEGAQASCIAHVEVAAEVALEAFRAKEARTAQRRASGLGSRSG